MSCFTHDIYKEFTKVTHVDQFDDFIQGGKDWDAIVEKICRYVYNRTVHLSDYDWAYTFNSNLIFSLKHKEKVNYRSLELIHDNLDKFNTFHDLKSLVEMLTFVYTAPFVRGKGYELLGYFFENDENFAQLSDILIAVRSETWYSTTDEKTINMLKDYASSNMPLNFYLELVESAGHNAKFMFNVSKAEDDFRRGLSYYTIKAFNQK